MTMAVCIRCGAQKVGAWVGCRKCGFEPTTLSERSKSMALSDHYLSPDDLRKVGERIASGKEIHFVDSDLGDLENPIREHGNGTHRGCWIALVTLALLVIGGVVAVFLFW